MADEDENHLRDWGHLKSPLFNKLPPEVRNKIYHETFAGSERDLVLDPPLSARVVPITGRRSIFTTAKSTHNFLLTCFQVYSEALAIYWSLTVIGNIRARGVGGHGRFFSRGYFLNRIPAIARKHVQHLRRVGLSIRPMNHWLQGGAIPWHVSVAECLDFFPNLKSFSISNDVGFFSHARDEVAARHPHIHILVKLSNSPGSDAPPLTNLLGNNYWSRLTFKDFTSGKSLTWYQPLAPDQLMSDEDAFQMVLNCPNVEIKATERRLELRALNHGAKIIMMLDPLRAIIALGSTAT